MFSHSSVSCATLLYEKGCLPRTEKTAIITPVLKKQNADPDEPKNYRSIFNLAFISKILERIVVLQVIQHLEDADLMPEFQSAYRKHHCNESALTKLGSVGHSRCG